MPLLQAEQWKSLGVDLFGAVGVPEKDALLVADHLVASGLLGHDSHSVLRFPQYVDMVRQGVVEPGASLKILEETACGARLSGGWNYGPITAAEAVQLAVEKTARAAMSVVTVQECNHIARLGRFAALAARQNRIALITSNGHGGDLAVAPFGGTERRLPTNPICIGMPSGHPWPVLLDMTTSMTSGGALRVYRNRGELVPDGCIIDAEGHPTRQVEDYYGPPEGAQLSLGQPVAGHKGFGLSVAIDILSGALSGGGCSRAVPGRTGNALFIAVLNIEAFLPLGDFLAETRQFIAWVKSSPLQPGIEEVVLPGEKSYKIYQQRLRDGLNVDDSAWRQITELAAELGVSMPV